MTKLHNASRFVFMNLEDFDGKKPNKLEKIDELFLIRLNDLIKNCTDSFENYEYSKSKMDVERFFWNMFADNYLEIVKKRIYNDKGSRRKSAQYTLYKSLLVILKLIAPIMPFVTEEIYQEYFRKKEFIKSIHLCEWPFADKAGKSEVLDLFLEILSKIRQAKTEAKKSMTSEIILTLPSGEIKKISEMIEDLKDVANASQIKEGNWKVEFL